ncbi:hypothetical protein RI367_005481 [Sorochytrium milnesiophthora]
MEQSSLLFNYAVGRASRERKRIYYESLERKAAMADSAKSKLQERIKKLEEINGRLCSSNKYLRSLLVKHGHAAEVDLLPPLGEDDMATSEFIDVETSPTLSDQTSSQQGHRRRAVRAQGSEAGGDEDNDAMYGGGRMVKNSPSPPQKRRRTSRRYSIKHEVDGMDSESGSVYSERSPKDADFDFGCDDGEYIDARAAVHTARRSSGGRHRPSAVRQGKLTQPSRAFANLQLQDNVATIEACGDTDSDMTESDNEGTSDFKVLSSQAGLGTDTSSSSTADVESLSSQQSASAGELLDVLVAVALDS